MASALFVLAGEQDLERVAGLHAALEIDVVRIDADEVFDQRARHLVAQRGLVDALIEPHAAAVVLLVLLLLLARTRDFGLEVADVDRT